MTASDRDPQPWSVRTADTVLARHPLLSRRWHYEPGVVLLALWRLWQRTAQARYYDYIKANVDEFVDPTGAIRTYRLEEYNVDQINEGRLLLPLYQATGDERYRRAAGLLHSQLAGHPRTGEGSFWHKQVYPHQVWLDGLYMALPFYAEYARRFGPPAALDDVAGQIVRAAGHCRDARTGLLYHGWDESRSQAWADPATGCSPSFWGRAMGWFVMALVDVLDHLPGDHPRRAQILAILRETMAALAAVQDPDSGAWYQVLDQGPRPANYLEASASCMFVYALARGGRQGFLDGDWRAVARRGYDGILDRFIRVDEGGQVHVEGICSVGGLGGKPYRDGSFDYYVGEKVIADDHKGVGAFILASLEVEALA